MNKIDELLDLLEKGKIKQKWSGKVKSKWDPPEGLFKEALKGHKGDVSKAVSSVQFYINRAGKGLDRKRKAVLQQAVKIIGGNKKKK